MSNVLDPATADSERLSAGFWLFPVSSPRDDRFRIPVEWSPCTGLPISTSRLRTSANIDSPTFCSLRANGSVPLCVLFDLNRVNVHPDNVFFSPRSFVFEQYEEKLFSMPKSTTTLCIYYDTTRRRNLKDHTTVAPFRRSV